MTFYLKGLKITVYEAKKIYVTMAPKGCKRQILIQLTKDVAGQKNAAKACSTVYDLNKRQNEKVNYLKLGIPDCHNCIHLKKILVLFFEELLIKKKIKTFKAIYFDPEAILKQKDSL